MFLELLPHLAKKSSDDFKDPFKLKLLANFDANRKSFLEEVPNYVLNL